VRDAPVRLLLVLGRRHHDAQLKHVAREQSGHVLDPLREQEPLQIGRSADQFGQPRARRV